MPWNPRNSAAESTDFCCGFYGFLPRILQISAADSTDFCHGFYGILLQIPRKPAVESADLISAEAWYGRKWRQLKVAFLYTQVCKKINFVASIKKNGVGVGAWFVKLHKYVETKKDERKRKMTICGICTHNPQFPTALPRFSSSLWHI